MDNYSIQNTETKGAPAFRLPNIRQVVAENKGGIDATVIGIDGSTRTLHLDLKILNDTERKTLLAGSMINLFKES